MDSQDNMKLRYTYLSDGTKVSALDAAGDGLLYRGSFVYEKNGQNLSLESISWDEGRIRKKALEAVQDQWFVKDHLGNVRSVIDLSRNAVEPAPSSLLERTHILERWIFRVLNRRSFTRNCTEIHRKPG